MKLKKLILTFSTILFALFSSQLFGMNENEIQTGKIVIKNINGYLYVPIPENVDKKYQWVGIDSSISSKSSFTIENRKEGYLIKNTNTSAYLYFDDEIYTYYKGERIVRTSEKIMSNSYFEIIKQHNKYIIKNKKYSDYVHGCLRGVKDEKCLISNKIVTETAYFTFAPFPESYF
jgi:hypothetical protein